MIPSTVNFHTFFIKGAPYTSKTHTHTQDVERQAYSLYRVIGHIAKNISIFFSVHSVRRLCCMSAVCTLQLCIVQY